MRLLKLIVPALLALAMLAGSASAIAAQATPTAEDGADLPEGVVRMYARSYSADMASVFASATPGAEPTGWVVLMGLVLEFESEDAATAGIDEVIEELNAEIGDMEGVGMEEVELDLDLDTIAHLLEVEEEGMTTVMLQGFAQDGVYVYATVGMMLGAGSDPVPTSEYLLQEMAATDVGDAEETFNADGTSEGGLWDKLPTGETIQEREPALTMVADEIIYPEGGEAGS